VRFLDESYNDNHLHKEYVVYRFRKSILCHDNPYHAYQDRCMSPRDMSLLGGYANL
jgi:hypothetical protein